MPGLIADGITNTIEDELNWNIAPYKHRTSPRSTLSPHSARRGSIDMAINGAIDTSIEQLYYNVCEMQSSDQSPSRASFVSYGEESRIDSELCHLVGSEFGDMSMKKEVLIKVNNGPENSAKKVKVQYPSAKSVLMRLSPSRSNSEVLFKSTPKGKSASPKLPTLEQNVKSPTKINGAISAKKQRNFTFRGAKLLSGTERRAHNPDLGPFLLKQTRNLILSGENPQRALETALRALKAFELCAKDEPNLEMVMCLHVLAAIYCSLGQYQEAMHALERSIEIPVLEEGETHALAKFSGCMQLGDTYAMLGQIENSILFYTAALEIQRQVLGETDPRFGETCRYVAEAHVQALQFDEAETLSQMALQIHIENGSPASLEEAADRRLMGLICESKGNYEVALEHYVLAGMAMAANGQELDGASIDCSIGDAYLSLARYDEAVFAFQKALAVFKSAKGENHPTVASVYVRLADLYNKTGKLRESKSYCENALRIYSKPIPGIRAEEIANGLIEVSAIYESMNELDQALKLLQRALKAYADGRGQHSTIAGIEAQMGVIYNMIGDYNASYKSFESAILKFRASGEKKTSLFGVVLNQMGLACVRCYEVGEAAKLFEKARSILEQEYGPYHPDTLGVYTNLAGTYDALGRSDEAIEVLEHVVGMREEKLGTANPEVDDEKRRLAELLKEAGRVRNRKSRSLEALLDANLKPPGKGPH